MRIVFVLAIAILGLLAFGVACGGDEEKAEVIPSPASEAEGWDEEEWDTDEGEAEEWDEADEDDDDDDGVADDDDDGVADDDDLCPGTAAGDAVDDAGCSDAQVDPDGIGVCIAGAPSGGPSECLRPD